MAKNRQEYSIGDVMSPEEFADLWKRKTDEGDVADPPGGTEDGEGGDDRAEDNAEGYDYGSPFLRSPESVGMEEKKEDNRQDEGAHAGGGGTSPKADFYSSIAKAMKAEGILDLDDDTIGSVSDAASFTDMLDAFVKSRLDEEQRRISEALDAGLEPDNVRIYENAVRFYDSATDDLIGSEDDKGTSLRRQLIFQDYLNKGYSKDRAVKLTQRSFDTGSDIEDAREARDAGRREVRARYDAAVKEGQEREKAAAEQLRSDAESMRKEMMEGAAPFGGVEMDRAARQRAYDAVMKPSWRDPSTGEWLTAVQKYERENRQDFMKSVGFLWELTDGFRNLDRLVGRRVRKATSGAMRELERTLSGSQGGIFGGPVDYMGGGAQETRHGNGREIDLGTYRP